MNQNRVPDVRMLNELRLRLGVRGCRWINDHLLREILERAPLQEKTVLLIDATDLPARAYDKKKRMDPGVPNGRQSGGEHGSRDKHRSS